MSYCICLLNIYFYWAGAGVRLRKESATANQHPLSSSLREQVCVHVVNAAGRPRAVWYDTTTKYIRRHITSMDSTATGWPCVCILWQGVVSCPMSAVHDIPVWQHIGQRTMGNFLSIRKTFSIIPRIRSHCHLVWRVHRWPSFTTLLISI